MPTHQPFTIRDARLFDGVQLLDATHLRVADGRIADVGGPSTLGAEDAVIDGAGDTLLPGLVDAHVHLLPGCTQLAATFGVTTLIDQFSKPEVIDPEKAAITAGQAGEGPACADMRTSSIGATAPGGHPTIAYSPLPYVTSPEDALPFVEARLAEGARPAERVGRRLEASDRWGWVVLDASPDLPRAFGAGEAGYEVQRHVDPGRDAGGGHHVAVVDEAFVGAHVDGRVELGESVQGSPVGGRGTVRQQPGRGVHQGTGADARRLGPAEPGC